MLTKKPRGQDLKPEQKAMNQGLARHRMRVEHVNSGVKRCRKDTIRLCKEGVRDLVMEICCALHNLYEFASLIGNGWFN